MIRISLREAVGIDASRRDILVILMILLVHSRAEYNSAAPGDGR